MFCHNCRSKIAEHNKFCTSCGTSRRVTNSQTIMKDADRRRPKRRTFVFELSVIAFVVLIAGGVLFVMQQNNTGLLGTWERVYELEHSYYDTFGNVFDERVVEIRFNRDRSGAIITTLRNAQDLHFHFDSRDISSFTWEITGDSQLLVTFRNEDGTDEIYLWDYTFTRNALVIGDATFTLRR